MGMLVYAQMDIFLIHLIVIHASIHALLVVLYHLVVLALQIYIIDNLITHFVDV